jgi:hypothetical protein
VAIVRNLTLIKCTPGYPMSSGTGVPAAGLGHERVVVARKRLNVELTDARVQTQTIDFPSHVSAPPHERRP